MQNPSRADFENHEHVQDSEGRGHDDKEISREHGSCVVPHEHTPPLCALRQAGEDDARGDIGAAGL
jgi:hypothetical protein